MEKHTQGGMVLKGAREGLHGPLGPGPVKLIPRCGPGRHASPRLCVAHHSTDSPNWQCQRSRRVRSQTYKWRSPARYTNTLPRTWPGQADCPRTRGKRDSSQSF